jgi:type I restriction enzyme S subunit
MKKGWQTKTLGDVAEISAGNSAPQDESLFRDGTHPFFRTADAGRVRFGDICESTDYLNEEGIKKLRRYPKGTILFPKSGASTFLNHRVMLGVEGFVSSHLATIVADDDQVTPRFLLYFLSTVAAQDLVQDHAYPSLNLPTIAGITVEAPPLSEQQRIVGILDEAFAGIAIAKANAEKNLQNARALFESHLQSVFTQRGPGWVEKPLGSLASFRNGINYTKESKGERIRIVGVRNFQKHFSAPLDDLDTVTIDGELNELDWLRRDDILAVRSNGNIELIGRCILVGDVTGKVSHSGFTIRIRLSKGDVLPRYLCHFMKSAGSRKRLTDGGTGTNIKSLNQGMLSALVIPFPPVPAQKALVGKLESLSAETQRLARLYERKLAALEALKKSLLHQAFTGQL